MQVNDSRVLVADLKIGPLRNFNAELMNNGIVRLVNDYEVKPPRSLRLCASLLP